MLFANAQAETQDQYRMIKDLEALKAEANDAQRPIHPGQNEELVRYFKGRRVWLLDPDEVPPKLSSYHEDRWSQ